MPVSCQSAAARGGILGFPAPYWAGPNAALYLGDVRACLRAMPVRSVHCVVTSPPYWNLRDYGTGQWEGGSADCDHKIPVVKSVSSTLKNDGRPAQQVGWNVADLGAATRAYKDTCAKCGAKRTDMQVGAEPSPDCGTHGQAQCDGCFVCSLVSVFREVYRVLRDDGTVWLNLGDSYAGSKGNTRGDSVGGGEERGKMIYGDLGRKDNSGLPSGNLVGVPWRVALALQADGWVLRSALPWVKRNSMPESVTNRPAKSVEDMFLLTKSGDYFFDMDAIKKPGTYPKQGGSAFSKNGGPQHREYERPDYRRRVFRSGDLWLSEEREEGIVGIDVPVASYPGAHFATFPPRLITPLIQASTSEHGCCAECGIGYEPLVEKERLEKVDDDGQDRDRSFRDSRSGLNSTLHAAIGGVGSETVGWRKACGCRTDEVVPAVVLDPFVGSGTSVATALQLGRAGVGIDLSETYLRENAVPRIEAALRGEKVPRKPTAAVVPDAPPAPRRLR